MTGAAAATKERDAPPAAVIIHNLDQARCVLAAARRTGMPVRVVSAPGAGAYLGPALFKQIADKARAEEPDARATFCLDCGDEPGVAMGALRHGVEAVTLSATCAVTSKVRDAAARVGADVVPQPAQALDMADRDCRRRLDAWLEGGTNDG